VDEWGNAKSRTILRRSGSLRVELGDEDLLHQALGDPSDDSADDIDSSAEDVEEGGKD
jgi:hypothetical protein